jgi:hypothetical protein
MATPQQRDRDLPSRLVDLKVLPADTEAHEDGDGDLPAHRLAAGLTSPRAPDMSGCRSQRRECP